MGHYIQFSNWSVKASSMGVAVIATHVLRNRVDENHMDQLLLQPSQEVGVAFGARHHGGMSEFQT